MRHPNARAAFLAFLGLWAAALAPASSETGLSDIEVVDVAGYPVPGRSREDRPVCVLEAKTRLEERFIRRLWESYGPVFGFKDWSNFGPDAAYRRIRIAYGGKTLVFKSWHPIYERDADKVVMSYGVTGLHGRSRAEVLKADDPGYLARRSAFDALVDKCLAREKTARPLPRR